MSKGTIAPVSLPSRGVGDRLSVLSPQPKTTDPPPPFHLLSQASFSTTWQALRYELLSLLRPALLLLYLFRSTHLSAPRSAHLASLVLQRGLLDTACCAVHPFQGRALWHSVQQRVLLEARVQDESPAYVQVFAGYCYWVYWLLTVFFKYCRFTSTYFTIPTLQGTAQRAPAATNSSSR